MSDTTHLVTAEELEKYPDDDHRYELVAGRVIRMSPTGAVHGWLVLHVASQLMQHVDARRLGFVLTEVGFRLASTPDTVRAPESGVHPARAAARGGPPSRVLDGPPGIWRWRCSRRTIGPPTCAPKSRSICSTASCSSS